MHYQNFKKKISKIKNENYNKYILSSNVLAKIIKCMMQSHLEHTSGSSIGVNVGVY